MGGGGKVGESGAPLISPHSIHLIGLSESVKNIGGQGKLAR